MKLAIRSPLLVDWPFPLALNRASPAMPTLPLRHSRRILTSSVRSEIHGDEAFVSGRLEDVHRFKVPQLRKIKDLGPYFHDDSAATLEEVVDYFNSDGYNRSADGAKNPVHLNATERANLLEFLKIL
jgi:cytochrome c peroxidase